MEQKTKAAILHDIIRKFAAGGKDITPDDWRAFVEAQNDGYRTGPEIGTKVPDFTLARPTWQEQSTGRTDGSNGLLLVFSRSAIGDPTAATSSSSCSSLLKNSKRTG